MTKIRNRAVGRPKKIDRDAAVFIARWWRVNCLRETVSTADAWIIDHWRGFALSGESVGMTEVAHVRAAIRRARETWLKNAEFILNDSIFLSADVVRAIDPSESHSSRSFWHRMESLPDDFEIDGCAIAAVEFDIHGDPRVWSWMPQMREARRGWTVPNEPPKREGIPFSVRRGSTPIALGIAEYVGLFRLGIVQRLYRSRSSWLFGSES